MKTITRTHILLLMFTLTLNSAYALPLPPEAKSIVQNQNYGSECFDPTVAQPTGKSVTDMAIFNCNTISDKENFCQCVDGMAQAMNFENAQAEFKNHFIRDVIMRSARNQNQGLDIKFRDAMLSEFIKGHELEDEIGKESCELFNEGRVNAEAEPVMALVHERMQTDIVSFVDNKGPDLSPRTSQDGRSPAATGGMGGNAEDEADLEQIQENVDTVKRARRIRRETNNAAVFALIRYAASTEFSPGRSFAAEFLNPSLEGSSGSQNQQLEMDFNSVTAKQLNSRKNLLRRLKADLSSNPALRESILGVDSRYDTSRDIDTIFTTVLTNSLRDLESSGLDLSRPITRRNQLSQLTDNQLKESIGEKVDKAFASSVRVQCRALNRRYDEYLQAFSPNGLSRFGVVGYQSAELQYDRMFTNNYSPAHMSSTEAMYREFEARLSSNYGQFISEDPSKIMVLLDIHYCTTAPTKPVPMSRMALAAMSGGSMETPDGGAALALNAKHTSAREVFSDAESRRKLFSDYSTVVAKRNDYDSAVQVYNNLALAQTELSATVERTARELTLERAAEAPNAERIAELETTLAEAQGELDQTVTAVGQAREVAEEAYTDYVAVESAAYNEFGEAFVSLSEYESGSGVDESGCYNRYILQDGRYIPNPNWAADAAQCQANLEQRLAEEFSLDMTEQGGDGAPPITSYYSTDAEVNQTYTIRRNTDREIADVTAVVSNASALRQEFEEIRAQIRGPERFVDGPIRVPGDVRAQEEATGPVNTTPEDPFAAANEVAEAAAAGVVSAADVAQAGAEIEAAGGADSSNETASRSDDDADRDADSNSDEDRSNRNITSRDFENGVPSNEDRKEWNAQLQDKFAEIHNTIDSYSNGQNPGVEFNDARRAELARIQREAREVEAREQALREGEKKYNEAMTAEGVVVDEERMKNDPDYAKLMHEIAGLRADNEKLRAEAVANRNQKKKKEKEEKEKNAAAAANPNGLAAETVNDKRVAGTSTSGSARGPASLTPARTFESGFDGGSQGVSTAERTFNPDLVSSGGNGPIIGERIGSQEVLPTPTSRGGELQDATITLNKDIDSNAFAVPILSGIDKSQEVLTGSYGFEKFLSLVGSPNELSLEEFNLVRQAPGKFKDLKINGNQPIIVRTPNGHMVMLPVIKDNVVTGFRYVKEIRPEHVDRRIASEMADIGEVKERLIYEADLDTLLETTLKK